MPADVERRQTLVIGTGLLGGAVLARLAAGGTPARGIEWETPAEAQRQLRSLGARLASSPDWRAAWCAGAGVVGASTATMRQEAAALDALLVGLGQGDPAGRLFVASSAGGVHAGGGPDLVTESSTPHPRSAYGEGKLALEQMVAAWSERTAVPVLVGRMSNLYGTRQDFAKTQGFVSHLCRNALRREPTLLRVPLETTRDFLHADDAATRICEWLERPGQPAETGAVTKLLVSGVSMTLARTIALVRSVSRRRLLLVHVVDPASGDQPLYLRFRSTVLTDLDHNHPARPLEIGILEVLEALRRQRAAGAL